MRFFDDGNKRFEWTIGFIFLAVVFYIGSFSIIRSRNTHPCEEDGCWYELVDFPTGVPQTIYLPLIVWDKKLFRVRYSSEGLN